MPAFRIRYTPPSRSISIEAQDEVHARQLYNTRMRGRGLILTITEVKSLLVPKKDT